MVEQFEMSQMAKNGVSKYSKIELPKNVIIRTETVEEVKSTKQAKIRKEGMMPPKPEEGIGKNGRKIVNRLEEAPIKKMKDSNRKITELYTGVPKIYYAMIVFGLISVLFGRALYPVVYLFVIIGGIGVVFVALIGILEIIYNKKRKIKITG